jgi:hypothetical protein
LCISSRVYSLPILNMSFAPSLGSFILDGSTACAVDRPVFRAVSNCLVMTSQLLKMYLPTNIRSKYAMTHMYPKGDAA